MIIHVDNNRDGYVDLFTKAYELLLANKRIEANDSGRLTSLEEFFSYIQDIIELDDRYLIRLPVDEPTLTIDANKRTIDTSVFGKSVTVQSDQIAEILVFSIDRYFDYKDLADEKIQIWVQWTAPDGHGGYVEGATYITHKDTETEKGKLRFGWPIHNEITANPGALQFAVRFFMKDDVEEYDTEGNLTKVNKIVYSLNTLPATLQIKSALQPELNDDVAVSRPAGLFSYAVRNSIYTGEDVAIPQTPTFEAPGSEPPMEATLENNTLTLMAQAVSGDAGSIAYKWYYKGVNAEAAIDCEAEHWGTIGTAYRISSAKKRILSDDYYNNADITTSDAKDIYYSHEDSAIVSAFKIHTGKVEYKEQADGSFMLVDDMGRPLYEKYTTLTVPDGDVEVTGTYTVKAWNTTTINGKDYTSNPRESRECVLVSPSDINVVNELSSYALITYEEQEDGEKIKKPAELQIELATKENDNTDFSYAWQRYDSTTDTEPEVTEGVNKFNAEQAGWYKVYITADLNRQTNEYTSNWCKVTEMPAEPEIIITSTGGTLDEEDGDNYTWDTKVGTELILTLSASVPNATTYDKEDLYSEGLTYAWTLQVADGEERPLTPEDVVSGSDITSNSITVISLGNVDEQKIYTYKCIVSNTLNNNVASKAVTYRLM